MYFDSNLFVGGLNILAGASFVLLENTTSLNGAYSSFFSSFFSTFSPGFFLSNTTLRFIIFLTGSLTVAEYELVFLLNYENLEASVTSSAGTD